MSNHVPPPSMLAPGSMVWAYLRDSGGDLQEQSVPQQEAEIRAYCDQYGLSLVHVFKDVARSGGSTAGREAFLDMYDLSAHDDMRPAGLLLWNFARFARDMTDADFYKATMRKRGLVIHSLTDPLPEGPFAPVIEKLIDFSNEEKRRQNSRDVKRALQALFKQGYSFGRPPTGFLTESREVGKRRNGEPRKAGKWVPDPELWDLVKLAWYLRADGRTYGEISARTEGKLFKSKNCWATFFRNKSYLGIGVHGELEIPDHHPAAIDLATWEAVQVIQAETARPRSGPFHPRRTGGKALISGLAYCSHCGAAIFKDKDGHGWNYYMCGARRRKGKEVCDYKPISSRKVDELVMDAVLNKILTRDYVDDLLEGARAQLSGPNLQALADHQVQLQGELIELDKKIDNLLDLVEAEGASAYLDRLKRRQGERSTKAFELRQIEAKRQAANVDISPEVLDLVLETWKNELKDLRTANDMHSLRIMVSRFVQRIDLGYNRIVIKYSFPTGALQRAHTGDIQIPVGAPENSELISEFSLL